MKIPALFSDAVALHRKNRLPEAEKQYRRILDVEPRHAEALHLMGVISYQQGDCLQAVQLIGKAIEHRPGNAVFYNNLGLALEALNRSTEAKKSYQKALQMEPCYADAHNNLANIFKKEGRIEAAVSHFQTALKLEPEMPEAHLNLGKTLADHRDLGAAINHYQQAIILKPDYAKAYNHLGNALKDQGNLNAAIENFRQAVRIQPDYISALNNLGIALRTCDQLDEAFEVFNRAIKTAPNSATSYCNLGNVFKDSGQYDKALESYYHAIGLKAGFAEAHFNCAMVQLLNENFLEGWREYEWRLQRKEWKSLSSNRADLPHWDGGVFAGKKLLVYDEQGFGDTLQFVRYLPFVKSMGGGVIFETRKELIRLLSDFQGADEVITRSSFAKPAREADFYISLLSLPGIFKTNLSTIPNKVPYLYADPEKEDYWRKQMNGKNFKVGIVWAGRPSHKDDHHRSCALDLFNPLFEIPGIELIGLQKGSAPDQADMMAGRNGFVNYGETLKDFADTAGLIQNLDLVISVDTAVAHLCGAMGKAVWVLLPYMPDWRWMLNREDSPWYPTMRLFRQTVRSNWIDVIGRIAKELKLIAKDPRNVETYHLKMDSAQLHCERGNRYYDQNDIAKAISSYKTALEIRPDYFEALFNLARAYQDRGNYGNAISKYQEAARIKPDFFQAYFNLGILFQEKGNFKKAVSCYEKALVSNPEFAEAFNNMGTVYQKLENSEKAILCFQQALELKPEFAIVHFNMGKSCYDIARYQEAVKYYNMALQLNPDDASALYNMGKAYYSMGDLDQAMTSYQRSLQIKPDNVNVLYDMGVVYIDQGRIKDMITSNEKALQIRPMAPEVHFNLAVAYKKLEKIEQAFAHCHKALELQPDFEEAFSYLVRLHQHACDWQNFEALTAKLDVLTKKSIEKGKQTAEAPMFSIRRHMDPINNQAVAKSWSDAITKRMSNYNLNCSFNDRRLHQKKMVIGYLSSDFKNQAVMHLMLGLFRSHNRDEFKILCYSHGKDDGSDYRKQIKQHCDQFIEIDNLTHIDAAKRIKKDKVDILVDLMGHTRGNRLEICALRPAPVQVSYLGFLGTSGSEFIDYIITDKIVTPKEHAPFYSEKFAYMPHCYQVNDNSQRISRKTFRRKDLGLPDDGFVFCCFNQPYKIDAVIFETWMNILHEVPQSVLWLLRQNRVAQKEMIRAAATKGIAPDRLVFANAMPLDEHLARLKLADLALDTRMYNGGATTSNALWSGVPVVTLQGGHFVSRMTASSLSAIGLNELVAQSPKQYESITLRLAGHRQELKAVKKKLAQNRSIKPLFDSSRFARNLERAYKEMWHIFIAGENPRQIEVKENSN